MNTNLSDGTYIWIGKSVQVMQICDECLKTVLLLAFPGVRFQDHVIYSENQKRLDKATLGKLIRILKQRVLLTDEFSETLENYLDNRNSLIHKWDRIQEFENDEDARRFVQFFCLQAVDLTKLFLEIIIAWVAQTAGQPKMKEDQKMLTELLESGEENFMEFMEDFILEIR
ncbi:MAG: hypothetical protein AAF431_07115 [Pseudomonadota bacterium]